jgi:hypothetical protein
MSPNELPPPTVLDAFPTRVRTKYPWHDWLDGRVVVLTKGVHFACSPRRLAITAWKFGDYNGFLVRSSCTADTVTLTAVRGLKRSAEARP